MSRTARHPASRVRAFLAAAAAVGLLAACGGDDDPAADSAPTTSAAAEPGGGSGDSAFCDAAAGIDQRVDSALSDLDDDDPSVEDAFRQIAVELREIEAPEAIADDWEALAGGLDRMADAFADLDITDSGSLAALDDAETELSEASSNVEDYLRDECGIEP